MNINISNVDNKNHIMSVPEIVIFIYYLYFHENIYRKMANIGKI